ncbi:MAG: HD domain-containing protein [Anaerovorax sp.]|nr:HD domain-containing protein [Anaerovorax sp.]
MEIVYKILKHPKYIKYMELNAEAERNRLFCKHDLQHAFDVARVAYIMSLEKDLTIEKEIIYATALLHDIAKWKQYMYGVDHASEGAILARKILEDIGFVVKDVEEIMEAISTHRKKDMQKSILGEVLYESDKLCRPCVFCRSIDQCNRFTDGKKPEIKY